MAKEKTLPTNSVRTIKIHVGVNGSIRGVADTGEWGGGMDRCTRPGKRGSTGVDGEIDFSAVRRDVARAMPTPGEGHCRRRRLRRRRPRPRAHTTIVRGCCRTRDVSTPRCTVNGVIIIRVADTPRGTSERDGPRKTLGESPPARYRRPPEIAVPCVDDRTLRCQTDVRARFSSRRVRARRTAAWPRKTTNVVLAAEHASSLFSS